jgi:hypothetical protein
MRFCAHFQSVFWSWLGLSEPNSKGLAFLALKLFFSFSIRLSGTGIMAAVEAEKVVAELRERCATRASLLRDVAAAMAGEMGAGLEKEGGSRVKMLLSYVDKLPTGREDGLFYGLDLGGTNFRVLKVHLGGSKKHVVNSESREVSIPPHLMSGTSSVGFCTLNHHHLTEFCSILMLFHCCAFFYLTIFVVLLYVCRNCLVSLLGN